MYIVQADEEPKTASYVSVIQKRTDTVQWNPKPPAYFLWWGLIPPTWLPAKLHAPPSAGGVLPTLITLNRSEYKISFLPFPSLWSFLWWGSIPPVLLGAGAGGSDESSNTFPTGVTLPLHLRAPFQPTQAELAIFTGTGNILLPDVEIYIFFTFVDFLPPRCQVKIYLTDP